MRLIIEYSTGSHDSYMEHVEPIIYESKKSFLADFEAAWGDVKPKDMYEYSPFKVGQHEFDHEYHRKLVSKKPDELMKYMDYEDPNNFDYEIILPEVFTLDEWFFEVEND